MSRFAVFLAAAAAVSIPSLSFADSASCRPRVIQSETTFPMRSQIRGQEGIVYVNVKIDESGRATEAQLQRSSGYRLLDHSATRSIVNDWLFDVSSCDSAKLPAQHLVAVQFQNNQY